MSDEVGQVLILLQMWTSVKRDHIHAFQTLSVWTQLAHMTAGVCLDIIGMDGVIVVEVEVQKFLSVYLSSYLSIYQSMGAFLGEDPG